MTWLLIAVHLAVWLAVWWLGPAAGRALMEAFGVTPARLLTLEPSWAVVTPFTSLFVHAGWVHVLGNVWFLHVFGDNVEDQLGRGRYLALYVLAHLCAVTAFVMLAPFGELPLVGASGGIAGVLGAYMLRFPRAPIVAWFVIGAVELPAHAFLLVWFGYQLVMTLGTWTSLGAGGVAFSAHVAGFLSGIVLDRILDPGQPRGRR